jgi:glycolate oxidase iron-sulfur subunit
MCQSVCPTFKATKLEYRAPRGRVQIIKRYIEGNLKASTDLQEALTTCILCDACAALCPSGVRIDRLLRNMRLEVVRSRGIPRWKGLLFNILLDPSKMRKWAAVSRIARRMLVGAAARRTVLGNIPVDRLPRFNSESFRQRIGPIAPAAGKRTGRVLYFTGCATDLFYHETGLAVIDVLTSLGIEVIIPAGQACCSAPVFLSGAGRGALTAIYRNLELFDRGDADAIVVDCATCGASLKKGIPELLEDIGEDAERAKRVAGKVKDVSQIVVDRLEHLQLDDASAAHPLAVTYHDPCHLIRGMGVSMEPRKLLRALPGVQLHEMDAPSECCGGGGAFQFENVGLSAAITGRKTAGVRASAASIVATGCPGCRLTLSGNLGQPDDPQVNHTIELVANRLAKGAKRSG